MAIRLRYSIIKNNDPLARVEAYREQAHVDTYPTVFRTNIKKYYPQCRNSVRIKFPDSLTEFDKQDKIPAGMTDRMAVAVLAMTLASRAKVQSTKRKNASRTRGSTASRSAEPAADATTKRCKRTGACVSHAISRAIESPQYVQCKPCLSEISLSLFFSLSLSCLWHFLVALAAS